MNNTIAKAGTLISVTEGCYSDYSIKGFFVVLRDFKPFDLLDAYIELNPFEKKEYHFNEDKFLAYLLSNGLLLEINYGHLHLSNYSSVEDVSFCPFYGGEEELTDLTD
jgi:hypothetical protein